MRLLVFAVVFLVGLFAQAPTKVDTDKQLSRIPSGGGTVIQQTSGRENDWCPVSVFVKDNDKTLVFTKDASAAQSCYLNFGTGTPVEWKQAATVTITQATAFDDVVYFFWRNVGGVPALGVSARFPQNYLCTNCQFDPPRTMDAFPGPCLVAGFYGVTGAVWNASGHPIVNGHQILVSTPMVVTYLPNTGYSFAYDATSPAIVSATQALQKEMASAQALTANLQATKATAVKELKAAAVSATPQSVKTLTQRVENTEKSILSVNEQIPRRLPSASEIEQVRQQLNHLSAQLSQTQMRYGDNMGGRPQYMPDIVQEVRQQVRIAVDQGILMQLTPPPASSTQACQIGQWSVDSKYLYRCVMPGKWVRHTYESAW